MDLLRLLFLGVLTCFCTGLVASDDLSNELVRAIDSNVKRLESDNFSGCILLELDGKVLVRSGYGYADQTATKRNRPELRFDIGSVTKPIVAAAVLNQVRLGTLRLDSTLGELLPDVPEAKRAISVEQLLSHTSGISRQYTFEDVDVANRDEVMGQLLERKLSSPHGARHEYSNANYFLLAAVLEVVAKRPFEDTLRETVFKPLGMKTAGFTGDQLADDEVSPLRYQAGIATGTMADWPYTWGHRGATGVLCNVDDLAAFAKALHTDTLFNDVERRDWLSVRGSHYSLGWSVMELPNLPRTIVHPGGSPGSRAILAYFPAHNATLVVLLNNADDKARPEWAIMRAVSATFAKKE